MTRLVAAPLHHASRKARLPLTLALWCSLGLVTAQTLESFDAAAGTGVLVWPSGDRYQGGVANGTMHGQGTLSFTNGSKLVGEFWQGAANGKGVHTDVFGSRYEGDFVLGKMFGRGTFVKFDGLRFEGDFIAGAFSGIGTQSVPERGPQVGWRREGHFLNWSLNGKGKLIYNKGKAAIEEGGFIGGIQNGPGLMRRHGDPPTKYWSADFVNGRMDGWAYAVDGDVRRGGQATNGSFTLGVPKVQGPRTPRGEELKRKSSVWRRWRKNTMLSPTPSISHPRQKSGWAMRDRCKLRRPPRHAVQKRPQGAASRNRSRSP